MVPYFTYNTSGKLPKENIYQTHEGVGAFNSRIPLSRHAVNTILITLRRFPLNKYFY